MKKGLVGLIVILLSSCFLVSSFVKAERSTFREDGSSIKRAIVIKYTGDYSESIGQEYEYIENNFGFRGKDWVLIEQRLIGENDKFTPISSSRTMNQNIPGSELKIIDNAGHISNLENSQEFNKNLTEFLEKINPI